ncbi:head GIN domain-containing protein [Hymenobacter sp. B1770]|uniref:head GIN domain-containing protein n=1 Tax=Hymenobacter sp. B1770 TaxID=1718788 RepID=UPI003CE81824
MNKNPYSLRLVGLFFSALVLLSGCGKDKADPMDQEIRIDSFEGLEIKAGSTVVLTEGSTQKVELRGADENTLKQLRTGVDNGTWKVEFDGNAPDQDRMTIEVTMPRLRRLILTGPSTVRGTNPFTFSDVSIVNTGSGSISLGLVATGVNVEVKGSGPIELVGTTAAQNVIVTGSGFYRGFGLSSANADAMVSGSGNAEVWATSALRAVVQGSGNVRYQGRPVITASTPGSGRVIDSN